jgi:hypothetical protein
MTPPARTNHVRPVEPVDTTRLFRPLHRELIGLLRGLDPNDWERPTSAGTWSVTQVAAHLLHGDLRKLSASRGRDDQEAMPLGFDELVEMIERDNARGVEFLSDLSPRLLTEPVFFDGRSGLISIDFQTDTTNVSWVYRTSDAGSSWAGVATISPGFSTVSLLDKEHWIESNGTETVRTADGGATWTHTASTTPAINLGTTQFVDESTGWGLESEVDGSLLFTTSDGGVTWRKLVPGTATAGPSASPSPSGTPTAVPSDQSVPALTVDHPTLTVPPASHLTDGQMVEVRVTGFGVGGKVWLSECASAADATSLGCGRDLAGQLFLVTDDFRAGSSTFTVSANAPIKYPSATVEACANRCVIVATLGDGYPYVVAPISFPG